MRDIFIGEKGLLLPNWLQAFPTAEGALRVSAIGPDIQGCVFWLHTEVAQLEWAMHILEQLKARFGTVRVIVLANVPDQAEAIRLFAQGASGYCHSYIPAEILKEIRLVVSHGGIWLGQDVLQRLISQSRTLTRSNPQRVSNLLDQLTQREREVALKAAEGLSIKEISGSLDITERTVKAHLTSIFAELKIRDRLQLALILNAPSN